VRFVQVYSGGNHNDASRDAHGDLVRSHSPHCAEGASPIQEII
jgi:hypothetical protein